MTRVLLLCEYPELNGAERSLLAILPAVQRSGFQLLALAPPAGPLAQHLDGLGIEVVAYQPLSEAPAERRDHLYRLIADRRPDVLHANSLAMARLSGPIARAAQWPSIAHVRDIVRLSKRAVEDVSGHSRLLTVSQAASRWHGRQGLPADKLHVLYNGVDLATYSPKPAIGSLRRQLGLPPEALLVGSIGQIGLRKGQDVLLDAARCIVQQLPQVHFVLIGRRCSQKDEAVQFEQQLNAAAARKPLRGHVHFLGQRSDVPELLNELDVLAHAARQEPLGRVLLEAAACALPVVATDVGGTREIFGSDGSAAVLVPAQQPAALATALLRLLGDQELARRLGARARERAEQRFDVARAAAGLVRHYQEVRTCPSAGMR